MITEKEKKMFDTEYFNILLINGFAISVQSKNTKHYPYEKIPESLQVPDHQIPSLPHCQQLKWPPSQTEMT